MNTHLLVTYLLTYRISNNCCRRYCTVSHWCRSYHLWPPQTPFDHIWAMVWSGARGNIAI